MDREHLTMKEERGSYILFQGVDRKSNPEDPQVKIHPAVFATFLSKKSNRENNRRFIKSLSKRVISLFLCVFPLSLALKFSLGAWFSPYFYGIAVSLAVFLGVGIFRKYQNRTIHKDLLEPSFPILEFPLKDLFSHSTPEELLKLVRLKEDELNFISKLEEGEKLLEETSPDDPIYSHVEDTVETLKLDRKICSDKIQEWKKGFLEKAAHAIVDTQPRVDLIPRISSAQVTLCEKDSGHVAFVPSDIGTYQTALMEYKKRDGQYFLTAGQADVAVGRVEDISSVLENAQEEELINLFQKLIHIHLLVDPLTKVKEAISEVTVGGVYHHELIERFKVLKAEEDKIKGSIKEAFQELVQRTEKRIFIRGEERLFSFLANDS